MAKFSERQRRKVKKKTQRTSTNYALGCLLLIVFVPIVALGYYFLNKNEVIGTKSKRVKTKYEEGLVGSVNRNWVLVGHEFEDAEKQFEYTVQTTNEEIPDNLDIQYRKSGEEEFLGSLERVEANLYKATLNAEAFGSGVLELEAVAQSDEVVGKKWTSAPVTINISYGLYIVWTMDWEGRTNALNQTIYSQMTRISDDHHRLPLTHFFQPNDMRGADYVKNRRDNYGDEIGLHLHMLYDQVQAAGVTVRHSPAWNSESNVSGQGGYDVPCSAYTYEEFVKLLEWSKGVFAANGLGTPTSFRAGGWYLDLDNVRALEDTGFKIDSSGRDARFWGQGYIASPWSLGSRTQPYKISTENINSDYPSPRYDIWEMANNAADSYWFSANDMITAMNDNFQNKPLEERRLVVILSHPHWFSVDYPKLQAFYADADTKYYPEDKGPFLYSTLQHYYEILESDPNPKYTD